MKTEAVSSYEAQAKSFLDKFGIKFRATLSDSKTPQWKDDGEKCGHHYRVTLSKADKHQRVTAPKLSDGRLRTETHVKRGLRICFDFWGSIHDAEQGNLNVTPYDVLACISGDANCPDTFKDFCGEYGYGEDSIKTLQTYRRVSAFSKRLKAFFTAPEIEALQEIQ